MEKEKELTPALEDAIFKFGAETLPDFTEIAIDSILKDGFLKDIPIVNSLLSAGKFLGTVRDAYLARDILIFSQQLNNGTVSQEIIKQHYEELEKNPKKKIQELEVILKSLSKNRKYIQDKILANFYGAYCNPNVDFKWSDFELMSQITEGLFPYDLVELHKIYRAGKLRNVDFDPYVAFRLSNLGLVNYTIRDILLVYEDKPSENPREATITKVGKTFWEHGMIGIEHYKDEWIL